MRLIEGFIMTIKHEKRKPAGFYPSIFQIFLSMLWGVIIQALKLL